MNIIARGLAFFQYLVPFAAIGLGLAALLAVWRHGHLQVGRYARQLWFLNGRQQVWVQRHRCNACHKTYSEQSALLRRGSWYARDVRPSTVDHWQYLGTSLRQTAEVLRSWMGHQERWLFCQPLEHEHSERCHLAGQHRSSVAG